MTFKNWLRKYVPMSSRTLNNRLDKLFRKIDAEEKMTRKQFSTVENSLAGLESSVKKIKSKTAANGKLIASLEDEVKTVENRVDALTNHQDEISKQITGLETSSKNAENHLNIVETKLIGLDKRLASIESRLGSIDRRLSTLEISGRKLEKLAYYHLDPKLLPHALEEWYKDKTGNILNLDNPQTYNEKIQWMKLYDPDPRKTLLADKLQVRDWVKEKIGEEHLVPLLAVYHRAEEIDFDSLPDSFVLKANHGSGMNIIVKNKAEANLNDIRSKARSWLNKNFAFSNGYELQYDDIPRRLIAEQYLENMDGDMPDYKFWCFDGKCQFIEYITDRRNGGYIALFDTQWNKLPFAIKPYKINKVYIPMPQVFPQMIQIAEKLAEGFTHVRVDLYLQDNNQIKFGEMTFSSRSGTCIWEPSEADLWVGEMFHLPARRL